MPQEQCPGKRAEGGEERDQVLRVWPWGPGLPSWPAMKEEGELWPARRQSSRKRLPILRL